MNKLSPGKDQFKLSPGKRLVSNSIVDYSADVTVGGAETDIFTNTLTAGWVKWVT